MFKGKVLIDEGKEDVVINIVKKKNCSGCFTCYNVCPFKCIEMKADEEGFKYPVINQSECRNCGLCVKVCPKIKREEPQNELTTIYVGTNKDQKETFDSSSGGIFVLAAKEVIANGGLVFGAAFDNLQLKHIAVSNKEDLKKLQKSKYIQSDINDSFKEVKKALKENRQVLFCGTPCQTAGLKKFLGEEDENLIIIDFVCHGVPSQKSFFHYLDYVRDILNENSEIKNIDFRSKTAGWEKYRMKIEFESGKVYEEERHKDLFMKTFLMDIMLRPSCYECNEKGLQRYSDLTIADAWGIQEYDSGLYREEGTSFIIVHNKKAEAFFNKIAENMILTKIGDDFIKTYNPNTYYSALLDGRRKKFFELLNQDYNFKQCLEKSENLSLKNKVEREVRSKYKGLKRRIKH